MIKVHRVMMGHVICSKCPVVGNKIEHSEQKSCDLMAHWIKWENAGTNHRNDEMKGNRDHSLNWMGRRCRVTCHRVELMVVLVDVFVQIDWSPDVRYPVIPIEERVNQNGVQNHQKKESTKIKLSVVAIHLSVMRVPNSCQQSTHSECRHAVHIALDCFLHSLAPILFVQCSGRRFENRPWI